MTWRENSRPGCIERPRMKICALTALAALALIAPGTAAEGGAAVPDFTFLQASDVHAPRQDSKLNISRMSGLGEIDLTLFGVKVPKPGFVIATGDTDGVRRRQRMVERIPVLLERNRNPGLPPARQPRQHLARQPEIAAGTMDWGPVTPSTNTAATL